MDRQDAHNTGEADDALARATAALRDVAVPDGPPPQLQADVLSALHGRHTSSDSNRRRPTMNALVKLAIAATIVIAIGSLLWVTPPWGNQLAFGDVLKKVNGTESVRFKAKTVVALPNAQKQAIDSAIAISGNRMRQELPGTVILIDYEKGEMLMLIEGGKQATRTKMTNVPPGIRAANLLEQFRTLKPEQGRDLGLKEIDGRRLHAFAVDNPAQAMTVYVDPQSREPVRIEAQLTLPSAPPAESVMTDFDWGAQVEPAELLLDVPPGYTEQTMTLDVSPPTEATLIEGLEAAAKLNGGAFPDNFDVPAVTHAAFAINKQGTARTPDEFKTLQAKLMPDILKVGWAVNFMLPANGTDFRYAGKGAKLGEAGRPVLWYRPKDTKSYRVIGADLSVQDVAQNALPKIESTKLPRQSTLDALMKPAATHSTPPPQTTLPPPR